MRSGWLITVALGLIAVPHPGRCEAPPSADESGLEFFEKKIRPLLVEKCHKCHSAEATRLEGGLRLDTRLVIAQGGDSGPVLVPGKPEESRLIEAIGYEDVDLQMPPSGKLSAEQIADLTRWVRIGTPWPADSPVTAAAALKAPFDLAKRKAAHWAWRPIREELPPPVIDSTWPATPADRFVLARLEQHHLRPAAEAERRTLLRRATFDLIGLPPSPADVEAFVADTSPAAWERVVDRLLASPAFGERWARHWLDLVRYAETRGHEHDHDIPGAFAYRDYVIRAFNADVPYDQFLAEHLAGDLVQPPRLDPSGRINESVLGTGFWMLGEWLHSPVDIRQDEADRVDNQIDVMSKTFLGLTVACARCHDHKFDAISTRDYYALAGFLHSSSYREVRYERQEHNQRIAEQLAALDAGTRARVQRIVADSMRPTIDRSAEYLLAARELVRADREQAAKGSPPLERLDSLAGSARLDREQLAWFAGEIVRARQDVFSPLHPWAVLCFDAGEGPAELAASLAPVAENWRQELRRATELPAECEVVVDYSRNSTQDWLTDGTGFGANPEPAGRLLSGPNAERPFADVLRRGAALSRPESERLYGMVRTPTFTIRAPKAWIRVRGSGQAFLVVDSHRMVAGPLHAVTKQAIDAGEAWKWHPLDTHDYIGHRAHLEFTPGGRHGQLAVSAVLASEAAPPEPARASQWMLDNLLQSPPESVADFAERTGRLLHEPAERVANDRLPDQADAAGQAELMAWICDRSAALGYSIAAQLSVASVLEETTRRRVELLAAVHESPVAPALLDANGFDEHVLIRGSHRNPGDLVPRRLLEAIAGNDQAAINFGSGRLELARRMTDPVNPFVPRVMVNRVWHHLFGRGIVPSVDNFGVLGEPPTHPELLDYLSRRLVDQGWSVKRLVREIMLSSTYRMSSKPPPEAGQQDPRNLLWSHRPLRRLEGESIRDALLTISDRLDRRMHGPGVSVHLTAFMDGRGKPTVSGPLDGDGRRSIYLQIRRNFLSPMMLAFDTPPPINTIGRRTQSNVPAQALILLNDPLVIEQARRWAARMLARGELSAQQRIEQMYLAAYARKPTPTELAAAAAFLDRQGAELGIPESNRRTDPRVWADLAQVLLNVKEFIYIE